MAGTIKRIAGPAYMGSSVADIYTPPASTMELIIRQIHFVNVTNVAKTFSLYIGGTGGSTGGTELFKDRALAANDNYDFYCAIRMTSTDFLSGVASAGSAVVIVVMGEQRVI